MWNKLTRHHAAMFLLTFICFSLYHASRKAFSNVKDSLSKEWSPTSCNASWPCPHPHEIWSSHCVFDSYKAAEPFLGNLDTAFLFSYAIGLYISGIIGDRVQLRILLAIGMWLSGILVFLFGTLTQWLGFYNKPFYLIIWALNGFFQSSGWPCVVAIVGNWFGKSGRGFIFGLWSSCASVGNIMGSLVAAALINYGYEVVFLYASLTLFGGGFIAFFGIINSPVDIGLEDPNFTEDQVDFASCTGSSEISTSQPNKSDDEDDVGERQVLIAKNNTIQPTKPINFFRAVLLPGVITYALIFAAIKLINYSLLFWLPYYLSNKFGWSDKSADQLSVWYDVGSIIGGVSFGLLSDWWGRRAPVLLLMMLAAPVALWGYQRSPPDQLINAVLMAIVGVFVGGASNIVGTAVIADIGKHASLGKNTAALATVTGIIDGTGSVGAGIGQFLVTAIQSRAGWNWVFYSFIIESVIVILCLLPPAVKDLKTWTPLQKVGVAWNRLFTSSVTD